ncbi:MAG: DUF1844 domain-containing protein [Kiritimatiellaeota bacterium]|nr:DUF1844 domain-containing protein [Kiritimatiellota bacterium]
MTESKPDINKVLFMHLVSMLAMSAIQQMGKLVDPGTGKAEINLEAAQATIDMLDMLEARTRGNLDVEETKLLKNTLMSLKMNYVETTEMKNAECRMQNEKPRDKMSPEGPKNTAPKSESPAQEKSEPLEPKPGTEQVKDPKFHKSYD